MRPTKTHIAYAVREFFLEDVAFNVNYDFKMFGPDLGGLCSVASLLLAIKFDKYNYKAEIVDGIVHYHGHAWVRSDDVNWDITAKQFEPILGIKFKEVYVFRENPFYLTKESFGIKESYEKFKHWLNPADKKTMRRMAKESEKRITGNFNG